MERKTTLAKCARELHNGKEVNATYVVWQAETVQTGMGNVMRPVMMGRAFATCDIHVDYALAQVLHEQNDVAIIRKETGVQ